MASTPGDGAENERTVDGIGGAVLDAVVSAVGVALAVFLPLTVVNFAFGADWLGVKLWLFVLGMVLAGVSLWLLRPERPWKDDEEDDDEDTGAAEAIGADIGHFEATVHALPPLSWVNVPPDDRASSGLRLFLASLLLFAASFVMERVFSVCAPGVDC